MGTPVVFFDDSHSDRCEVIPQCVYCLLFKINFFFILLGHTRAYGGSQARGRIRAVAVSLHHSLHHIATLDPSCVCYLHHSSWQYRILNPLNKARDQTCILSP